MKKIMVLLMLWAVGGPHLSFADDVHYLVCNGNAVDDYIDIYFTAHTTSLNRYDVMIRSGYQSLPVVYLGTTVDHFWVIGKTDHTGQGYVIVASQSATTNSITVENFICQPHTSSIGTAMKMFNDNITAYVWFFAGVLAAAVVIAGIA